MVEWLIIIIVIRNGAVIVRYGGVITRKGRMTFYLTVNMRVSLISFIFLVK